MKDYAIRINIDGRYHRFATDRITIDEEIGGEVRAENYLPLVTEFGAPTIEIDYGSEPTIPTMSVGIWDGVNNLMGDFRGLEYEAAEATVFFVEDGEVVGQYRGYMTDVSFEGGVIDFTIRMDEDTRVDDFMERFTPASFQYFQVMTPRDIDARLSIDLNEDCPWTVATGIIEPMKSTGSVDATDVDGNGDPYDDRVFGGTPGNPFWPPEYTTKEYVNGSYVYSLKDGASRAALANSVIYNLSDPGASAVLGEAARSTDADTHTVVHEPLSGGAYNEWRDGDNYKIEFTTGDDVLQAVTRKHSTIAGIMQRPNHVGNNLYEFVPEGIVLNEKHTFDGEFGANGNFYIDWQFDDSLGESGRFVGTRKKLFAGTYADGDDRTNGVGGWVTLGSPNSDYYCTIPYYSLGKHDGKLVLWIEDDGGAGISPHRLLSLKDEGAVVRPAQRPQDYPTASDGPAMPDNNDVVYVRSNGFFPFSRDGDAAIGGGFIDMGETHQTTYNGRSREIREAYRFKLQEDALLQSEGIIGLEIHNSLPRDSSSTLVVEGDKPTDHSYAINEGAVLYDIPMGIDEGHPVKFMSADWVVKEIDFFINNMVGGDTIFDDSSGDEVAPEFENRHRGSRFDLLRPLSELRDDDSAPQPTETDLSRINKALLGQASGKFAVCVGSEVRREGGEWFERVYFSVPGKYGDLQKSFLVDEEDETQPTEDQPHGYTTGGAGGAEYVNHLRYMTEQGNASGSNFGRNEALNHFKSRSYRLIKNPVPEGGQSLGQYFPIAYGYLEKVPVMQVVSKKVLDQSEATAGDDLYIYAANECDVAGAADIRVYLDESQGSKEPSEEDKAVLSRHLIESPFPYVLGNHYTYEWVSGSGLYPERVRTPGEIFNPYHRVKVVETREGQVLQAVELRGGEWNIGLGALDRRFPIRNGVGGTRLFASFAGQVDTNGDWIESGAVLNHPLDILAHYVSTYGEYPLSEDMLDKGNIEKVKAQTPHYEASVFINEPMTGSELIESICKQFGFYWYMKDGKLLFGVLDIGVAPDWSNPLCYNLNLGNKISEGDQGYQSLYNKVVYNYRKNWMTDSYDSQIELNPRNNQYCRGVDKVKGGAKDMKLDAPFVHQPHVAREVITRLTQLNSSRKIVYGCEAKYVDGIKFHPGQVVPMTYPPNDIVEEPVMIKSITEGRYKMDLEVVRFPNIFRPDTDFRKDLEASKPDNCSPFHEPI
jgi:hypothetical protein